MVFSLKNTYFYFDQKKRGVRNSVKTPEKVYQSEAAKHTQLCLSISKNRKSTPKNSLMAQICLKNKPEVHGKVT
jgi:hypothetical protein